MIEQASNAAPAANRLSQVKAISFTGCKGAVGERPEQLWVKVADLRIDHGYQRRLSRQSHTVIRRMVESWSWAAVQSITVAELPGGLWQVIDGQHRAVAAATHGGIPMLPATVLRGVVDTRAAAQAFIQVNAQRVAMPAYQRIKAAIAAGDADAMAVWRAADAAGVRLLFMPPGGKTGFPPASCIAANTLLALAKKHGEAVMKAILQPCAAARLAPITRNHLLALVVLLTNPALSDQPRDDDRLVAALQGWEQIDQRAQHCADPGQPLPLRHAQALLAQCTS